MRSRVDYDTAYLPGCAEEAAEVLGVVSTEMETFVAKAATALLLGAVLTVVALFAAV